MDKTFSGLNEMARVIYENNKEKGFWDNERNPGEALMLVVSELGEAMEALRKGRVALPPLERYIERQTFEQLYKDTFEDELADAVIRILDWCGGNNIDIEFHVREKVKYNKTRERLHGKRY